MRVTVDCSNGKRGPDIPFLPLLRARNSTARLCVRKVPCRPHQGSPTWPLCSPVRPPSTGPPGSLLVISHVLTGPHSSTCVLEGMQPTTPLPAVRFQSSFPSPGKPLLTPGFPLRCTRLSNPDSPCTAWPGVVMTPSVCGSCLGAPLDQAVSIRRARNQPVLSWVELNQFLKHIRHSWTVTGGHKTQSAVVIHTYSEIFRYLYR